MKQITDIVIIYNPNSTGPSKKNAHNLKRELSNTFSVRLIPTTHPGHAEEIARDITETGRPHIIASASGDGGYHEVINGVLSCTDHSQIVTAIIPSGNANDHYRALSNEKTLANNITEQNFQTIDVLELQCGSFQRYAHSYIGFGVTPHVGVKLTEASLNRYNEIWIVLKNLFTVRPVKITWNGRTERYDNLLFSNIGQMSKVIKLTDAASFHDGKYEITANKSRSIMTLVAHLIHASTVGLATERQATESTFTLKRATNVQLDGEIHRLPSHSKITIRAISEVLRCVA